MLCCFRGNFDRYRDVNNVVVLGDSPEAVTFSRAFVGIAAGDVSVLFAKLDFSERSIDRKRVSVAVVSVGQALHSLSDLS